MVPLELRESAFETDFCKIFGTMGTLIKKYTGVVEINDAKTLLVVWRANLEILVALARQLVP